MVNACINCLVAKLRLPQFLVSVDVPLKEVGVVKQLSPPETSEPVTRFAKEVRTKVATLAAPCQRVIIATVSRFDRAVKVSDRSKLDFLANILVEERTQTLRVDIHRNNVEQMVINPGIDLNVFGIAFDRIIGVRPLEDFPKFVEISSGVLLIG